MSLLYSGLAISSMLWICTLQRDSSSPGDILYRVTAPWALQRKYMVLRHFNSDCGYSALCWFIHHSQRHISRLITFRMTVVLFASLSHLNSNIYVHIRDCPVKERAHWSPEQQLKMNHSHTIKCHHQVTSSGCNSYDKRRGGNQVR